MNSLKLFHAKNLAEALAEGLHHELHLSPKPGLVDRYDSGSHSDLSLEGMKASIRLVDLYLRELQEGLARQESLETLVSIGRRAERRMFAELGTNTHKGAIFIAGLLVVARSRIASDSPQALSQAVAELSQQFFCLCGEAQTNGARARKQYHLGGVVEEARNGLPSLFEVALPAYREGLACSGDEERAAFLVLARLMQTVEDTTAIHRCGQMGLARLRRDGRAIEKVILQDDNPTRLLAQLNEEYRTMNLTMGGVADMLGVSLGYLEYLGELEKGDDAAELPGMNVPGGFVCL